MGLWMPVKTAPPLVQQPGRAVQLEGALTSTLHPVLGGACLLGGAERRLEATPDTLSSLSLHAQAAAKTEKQAKKDLAFPRRKFAVKA